MDGRDDVLEHIVFVSENSGKSTEDRDSVRTTRFKAQKNFQVLIIIQQGSSSSSSRDNLRWQASCPHGEEFMTGIRSGWSHNFAKLMFLIANSITSTSHLRVFSFLSFLIAIIQVFKLIRRFGTFSRLGKIVPIFNYTGVVKMLSDVEAARRNIHNM